MCAAASACDVDLEKLLFGGKGGDPFFKAISQLASYTQSVGQSADDAAVVQERVKTLMNAWIDFDNRYSRKPPEWASGDMQWTEKIKSLTAHIGKLRQSIDVGDSRTVHSLSLELHGRILQLTEASPMVELHRRLLEVSLRFCNVESAVRAKDLVRQKEAVTALASAVRGLAPHVSEKAKLPFQGLLEMIAKVEEAAMTTDEKLRSELKMRAALANDEFRKINRALADTGNSEQKE